MRRAAPWLILALALAFPLAMQAEHQTYYLSFASRIFVYALAATSLNLILGYGGMISFGHAAFVGTGAYVSSILLTEGPGLVGSLLVGVVDTIGRAFLPILFGIFFQPRVASAAGPAIASVLVYLLMAAVLSIKPQGLFPARG